MKRFKKLASVLLAVVMVLAMSVQGFAASGTAADGNKGVIQINNAVAGKKYNIYKVFTLESYNYADTAENTSESGNYAYTIEASSPWYNFVTGTGEGAKYVTLYDLTVDSEGKTVKAYVKWNEGESAADFAAAALTFATTASNNVQKAADEQTAKTTTVTFTGLPLGYYLVDSSLGALCSLNSTNPTAEISEKNSVPEIQKTSNKASATIGEDVTYTITINVGSGATGYVLEDTLSDGLSFNGDISVANNGGPVSEGAMTYEKVAPSTNDSFTFKLIFNDAMLSAGDVIVVTYSAKLNTNAVDEVNTSGESNTAVLKYGDGSQKHETNPQVVYTQLFDVNVFKYTGTNTGLANAEFQLASSSNAIKVKKLGVETVKIGEDADNNDIKVDVDVYCVDPTSEVDTIITGDTGRFIVKGLGAYTYTLEEKNAPDGYNKLTFTPEFSISSAGNTVYENNTVDWISIQNNSGNMLPSTGGMGTTIFYVAGIVLMAGAVFFVVRKKRG